MSVAGLALQTDPSSFLGHVLVLTLSGLKQQFRLPELSGVSGPGDLFLFFIHKQQLVRRSRFPPCVS